MIPFSTFLSNCREIAVPEQLGDNLVTYFRNAVVNGLISVQTYIECQRDFHIDFYGKEHATDFCGADILNGPRGIVTSVFAYLPGTDCRKEFYTRRSTEFVECRIEESRCARCDATDPPTYSLYTAPYCNVPAFGPYACDSIYVSDPEDDTCFRASERWFAIGPDYRFYLYPRFPCGYLLGVQWQGIKRVWLDNDGVCDDEDLLMAVSRYAEAELARKDGEFDRMHELMGSAAVAPLGSYRALLRDMRHRCQQERRIREPKDCTPIIDSLLPLVTPLYVAGSAPVVTC